MSDDRKVHVTATTPDGEKLGEWETHEDGRHVIVSGGDRGVLRDAMSAVGALIRHIEGGDGERRRPLAFADMSMIALDQLARELGMDPDELKQ